MIKVKTHKKHNYWNDVILDYLGKECIYCGSVEKLNIHHIIPISKGGQNTMSNLEVLCSKCHHLIHRQLSVIFPRKINIVKKKCWRCNRIKCVCDKIF